MTLAHICMDEIRLAWPLVALAVSTLLLYFPSLRRCRAYKKCKGRSDGHEH
jgi:hypothetical protein